MIFPTWSLKPKVPETHAWAPLRSEALEVVHQASSGWFKVTGLKRFRVV